MAKHLQIDDDRLLDLIAEDATIEKVASDLQFVEGPVWVEDRLIFSDIPAKKLYSFKDGKLSVFREESHAANGNTLDAQGHLLSCEHESRVVSITEPALEGERRVLVDSFDNDGTRTRFNSPNDIVAAADGTIYFTDPYWGIPQHRRDELMEYGGCWVFCVREGVATPVAKDFKRPNGLAFTPDQSHLLIADDQEGHVRKFKVEADHTLSGGEVFCSTDNGIPDGIRVHPSGNLFSSAGDGVHVFDNTGKRLGKILVPESPANLCFGGPGGKTLFMTARTGLYTTTLK